MDKFGMYRRINAAGTENPAPAAATPADESGNRNDRAANDNAANAARVCVSSDGRDAPAAALEGKRLFSTAAYAYLDAERRHRTLSEKIDRDNAPGRR